MRGKIHPFFGWIFFGGFLGILCSGAARSVKRIRAAAEGPALPEGLPPVKNMVGNPQSSLRSLRGTPPVVSGARKLTPDTPCFLPVHPPFIRHWRRAAVQPRTPPTSARDCASRNSGHAVPWTRVDRRVHEWVSLLRRISTDAACAPRAVS